MDDRLYLGVSRVKITPEVGGQLYGYAPDVFSESVHDDINATAFYFSQGRTQALMVSLEVCLLNTDLSKDICALIEQKYRIPKENCILHCIHTHSGPNVNGQVGWGDTDTEYCEKIFVPAILEAVEKAKSSPVAVKMAVAAGDSYIGVNRRQLKVDNGVALGQNPWGSFNPQMTVISFADDNGNCVANIIHYGMHGTCAGRNHEISRDWAGVMIDDVERLSGGVTAFFNGAEGDVGPRLTNGMTTGCGDIGYVERHGALAAHDACGIYRKISSYRDVELSVLDGTVDIPLDKRIDLETAKAGYEEYKQHTVNLQGATAHYYKRQIELYEEGYVDQAFRTIPQTIIRVGDVAFVAFPYELFSEIAMRIAQEKKVAYTLSLSNTNGSEGYFVTQDQICRGGYEVNMFKTGYHQPYADDSDWHLVTQTLENLDKLNRKDG